MPENMPDILNIRTPHFFEGLNTLLNRTDADTLSNYVKYRVVASSMKYLSEDFLDKRSALLSDDTRPGVDCNAVWSN